MKGFILTAKSSKGQNGILSCYKGVNMIKEILSNDPLTIKFTFNPHTQFKEIRSVTESDLKFFLDKMFSSRIGNIDVDFSLEVLN